MIDQTDSSQSEFLRLEYKLLKAGKIKPDSGKVEDRLEEIEKKLGIVADSLCKAARPG